MKAVVSIDRTLDINHPHDTFVRKKRKSFADSHRSYSVVISKIKTVIICSILYIEFYFRCIKLSTHSSKNAHGGVCRGEK